MAGVIVLSACNREAEERPPVFAGGSSGTTSGVVGTSPGLGGGVNEGGEGETQSTFLSGRIVSFNDDQFSEMAPFSGSGGVAGPSSNGAGMVEGVFEDGLFELEGVRDGNQVFLSTRPDAAQGDFFGTFSRQDTTAGEVDLPVIRGDTLDEIFSATNTGIERAPGTGQVVVRTVDPSGQPVSGVNLEVPGSDFVRFSEGGSFFNTQATTSDGLAFAGNVTASEFPGDSRAISLTGPATVSEEIPVAGDMVTVVETVIEP